jgi:NAD(P)-dependent dehydrogenase (short-subunit alcohol dehydrogenase family)/3-oxoacyl-(acyl-carrier-protein) synthase
MPADDFSGRVVLITGGAKGVGRAVVRAFARRGATVLVNYFHSREAAEALHAELAAAGAATAFFRASVAKREQLDEMFEAITAEFGRLDVLVNNAALGALRPLDQLDERDWTRTFDTILKGSLWCSQRAARLMSSGGAIVNLSSIGAPMVLDGYTAIGTAKAALESLTRYLAVEYAPAGIRVNTASGGLIDGSVAELFPGAADLRSTIAAATPLGRLGTESELAEVAVFLASPNASWVTGQCLLADGGLSLGHAMLTAGAGQPTAPDPAVTPVAAQPDPSPDRDIDAGMGIAVVGMGIKVPGATDPESFFRLLLGDRPVFTEPGRRWDIESFWAPTGSPTPDSTYSRTLGFIHDEEPDGIPAEDYTTSWLRHCLGQALAGVHRTDDDRHLFAVGYTADGSQHLEESTVWESIRHRLFPRVDLSDPATSAALQTLQRRLGHANDNPLHSFPHAVGAAAAAGLLPPDTELLMLDTACSSSLYAVDTGIRALRDGSCDIAVAAAAFAVGPRNSTLFAGLRGLSASNDVRSFDADADGVLFSDGAAVVVLKTLDRARADNDHILGLLTGIGTSADGRGKAIYAPNTKGQQVAVDRAWTSAGIGATDLDWVVAHATGTRAGDQVEVQTLKTALADSPGVWVTSNKSILGHTGWVAGIVSLIHVLQALDHQLIPGQRRFTAPPAAWQLESSPLNIPTADQPWRPGPGRPRTAAVSGFGFGGTNAHLVVREYSPTARYSVTPAAPADDPVVVVGWSAQLPGGCDRETVRRWLAGDATAVPQPSFGEEFGLPAVGTFRIPSTTLNTIDRCQVLAMQCVQGLDERLGQVLERHRLSTAVVAGHMGPTRNGVGYALRTYLRYLIDRIGDEDELAPLRAALPGYAAEVRALVPVTNEDATPGIMPNVIPARITNYFDYAGANLTVDTGFGSGLAAAGLAIDRIRDGDWDFGLVLGVNGNSTPELRGLLDGSLDGAEPAEGAVLLALTRRSVAEREQLPVLAELSMLRGAEAAAATAAPQPALAGRHYLGAQGTLELLAALGHGRAAAVTCTDAITGGKIAVQIRPTGAEPEPAAARPTLSEPHPDTITPFAVEFIRCEAENVRSALPALPPNCLIVTDAPDDLPRVDRSSLILSTVPARDPGVVAPTGPLEETTVADAIAGLGAPLRHLRVVVTLGPDREPTEPGFAEALRLADLTFMAARAIRAEMSGGSCCLLALDAVGGARPRAVAGMFTGMIKTLGVELPGTAVFALLTTTVTVAGGLAELVAESRRPRLLPVTVLVGGRRFVPMAVPRPETDGAPGPIRIDRNSVVVAAGGSRGVTAALLTAIARRSMPTLWVLGSNPLDGPGRDEPPQTRAEFLAAAHAAGSGRTLPELNRAFDRLRHAQQARSTIGELTRLCGPDAVRYRVCDLTDPEAVRRTVDEITVVDGRVDLVVLGAGINRSAALDRKRLSDFRAVRDVKALGYANLRRAFAGRPPAAWCNLGSILGFTGQPGEIDYTAGNDLLAGAAYAGRSDGCEEFTIGWTLWDSIGLAADPVTRGYLRRSGFSAGMSTAEGVRLFLGELDRPARDRVTVHLGSAEKDLLEKRFPGIRAAMTDAAMRPEPDRAPVDTDELPSAIGRRELRASCRTFDTGERITDYLLDLAHDRYLADHLVNDRPTLPGTFALELAAMSAEELCPGRHTIAFEHVVFRKFLRLHPNRPTMAIRVRATVLPAASDAPESLVHVTITSDVRAPSGEMLIADQVHADLDVVLADRMGTSPVPPRGVLERGRPTVDPYLISNPAVLLSGPMDTLRSPVLGEHEGQAMFVLRPEAYRAPFDRFRIPALLLDGLARTSVLVGGDHPARPLFALSGIERVDLFDARADGRNDIALATRYPRIRLISGPDPATPGAFCGEAVAESGTVLARMTGLEGVLLGWCAEGSGDFRAAGRGRRDRFQPPGGTRSSARQLHSATARPLDE